MSTKTIHEKYHSGLRLHKKIITSNNFTYKNIIKSLSPYLLKGINCLDVGCGTGTLSFYISSKGIDVLGIDISQNAINMAKKNSIRLNQVLKTKFKVSDISKKQIKKKFDLILLTEVLEHTLDDFKVMRYLAKLLNKGGIICISVPSRDAPLYKMGLLSKFDLSVGHVRRYSKEDIRKIIKESHLSIKEFHEEEGIVRNTFYTNYFLGKLIRFIRGPLSEILTFIDNVSINLFGPSQYIIIARK